MVHSEAEELGAEVSRVRAVRAEEVRGWGWKSLATEGLKGLGFGLLLASCLLALSSSAPQLLSALAQRPSAPQLLSSSVLSSSAVELLQKGAGPSQDKKDKRTSATGTRGRSPDTALSAAHRLKLKAEKEDRNARKLRKESGGKYDQSQELIRKAGILAHQVGRISRDEASLHQSILSDSKQIGSDNHKLAEVAVMKKEIQRLKEQAKKHEKAVMVANQHLSHLKFVETRDKRRESDQRNNVKKMLRDASKYASEAESSLRRSQKLQMSSESTVSSGTSGFEAADAFEDANKYRRESHTFTHKALDARSKAHLGQEYVAILTNMVKHDHAQLEKAKSHDKKTRQTQDTLDGRLHRLTKKLASDSVPALRSDEEARKAHRARQNKLLEEDQKRVSEISVKAKRENAKAMHLLHQSHKLQAKAAAMLSASTRDIEMEEQES